MNFSAGSQWGESCVPKEMAPTAPGNTLSAGVGRNDVLKDAVPTWRRHWIAVTLLSGNVASIVAGAGWELLICWRIFSSTAVALSVVNTLAATIRRPCPGASSIALRKPLRDAVSLS